MDFKNVKKVLYECAKTIKACHFFVLLAVTDINAKSDSDFVKFYKQIQQELDGRIKICRQQHGKIVNNAFTNFDTPIRGGEYYEFIKDEQQALKNIEEFDLSKLTDLDEQRFHDLISEQCSKTNLIAFEKLEKKRKSCIFPFDGWRYMTALIYAQKNNPWSEQTKEKGKSKIYDYITWLSGQKDCLSKILALSLLETMVDYELIDAKNGEEIKQARAKAEKRFGEINDAIKLTFPKDKKRNPYSCDVYKLHKELEIPFSQSMSVQITAFLKKIKS